MKGLSNVVAAIIAIVILLTLGLTALTMLQTETGEYQASLSAAESSIYFHNLMESQLKNGVLNVSYYAFPISSNEYCLELTFQLSSNVETSGPYSVNITEIFAYTSNGIVPINLNYPVEVQVSQSPYTVTFTFSSMPDIYIVFQNGVTVFIPPNSSV